MKYTLINIKLSNELQQYRVYDMIDLNSLIRENKYVFKAENDQFVNCNVRRVSNVHTFYMSSCKTDVKYQHVKSQVGSTYKFIELLPFAVLIHFF